eukprot:3037476-Pyramimonas_sp.AAC.1
MLQWWRCNSRSSSGALTSEYSSKVAVPQYCIAVVVLYLYHSIEVEVILWCSGGGSTVVVAGGAAQHCNTSVV